MRLSFCRHKSSTIIGDNAYDDDVISAYNVKPANTV